jgi:hypothetical protein
VARFDAGEDDERPASPAGPAKAAPPGGGRPSRSRFSREPIDEQFVERIVRNVISSQRTTDDFRPNAGASSNL